MANPDINPENESGVLKDILSSFYGLVRSEIRLAKTEIAQHGRDIAGRGMSGAVSIGMIFFGAQALVAFLVLGLGHLLGDRFWLSALIVGVAMAGLGGLLLQGSLRKIRGEADVPELKSSLQEDREFLGTKVHDITERFKQTRIQS